MKINENLKLSEAIEKKYILGFIVVSRSEERHLIIRTSKEGYKVVCNKQCTSEMYFNLYKEMTSSELVLYINTQITTEYRPIYKIIEAFTNYEQAFRWYLGLKT